MSLGKFAIAWGALGCLVWYAEPAHGQERTVDPVVRALGTRTGVGGRVRLTWPDGERLVGRVAVMADSGVVVRPRVPPAPRPIPREVFVTAERDPIVEVGRAGTDRGAFVGAVAGVTVAAITTAPLVDFLGAEALLLVVPYGAALGLMGAGVGALIGGSFTQWDVVYEPTGSVRLARAP